MKVPERAKLIYPLLIAAHSELHNGIEHLYIPLPKPYNILRMMEAIKQGGKDELVDLFLYETGRSLDLWRVCGVKVHTNLKPITIEIQLRQPGLLFEHFINIYREDFVGEVRVAISSEHGTVVRGYNISERALKGEHHAEVEQSGNGRSNP